MATQAELAEHLDMGQPAVADLVKRGVIARAEPGQYDLDQCRVAYIRHLREQAAGRAGSDLATWRSELAKEQAEKAARENAVARGELIPAADVQKGLESVIGHCRARLLAIPSKGAPLLAMLDGRTVEIKDKLTELIHDALAELERTVVVAVDVPIAGGAGDAAGGPQRDGRMGAAAEADGQRVGRPAPGAEPGVERGAREVEH